MRTPLRPKRRSRRRKPRSPRGRARRRRSGTTSSCAFPRKFSPAARNLADCWRVRKARRCRKRSAKSGARGRYSTSSPARRCVFRARRWPACARGSISRSRAKPSAWSESSRRGISRSRFPRGRSRRRSPSATPSSSSPPISCRDARMRSPRSSCVRERRRASSISSWAAARWSARRCWTIPTSTRSPSPDRSRPAGASPRRARRGCGSSSSKWAARIRSSSSTTRISRPRSNARSTAPISPRVSAARRPRA